MSLGDVFLEINKYSNKIDKALALKDSRPSIKDSLVVALVSLSRQHYLSIFLLAKESTYYSSAFALIRPLIDAVYRAIWLMKVATDNQVEKINNNEKQFMTTQELSKKIDRKFHELKENKGEEQFDIFHNRYNKNSQVLHGLTHGGMEQIHKQLKDGIIYPAFTEEDLVGLLSEATVNYVLLLIIYGEFNKNKELDIVVREFSDLKLETVFKK